MDVKVSEAPDNSSLVTLKLMRDGTGNEVSVYWEAVGVEGSLFTENDIHPEKGYARFQKGLPILSSCRISTFSQNLFKFSRKLMKFKMLRLFYFTCKDLQNLDDQQM